MANLAEVAPDAEAALKPGSASHRVLTYLRTMEARDLAAAKAMQAPGPRADNSAAVSSQACALRAVI